MYKVECLGDRFSLVETNVRVEVVIDRIQDYFTVRYWTFHIDDITRRVITKSH